jgi:hypothetical protein
MYVSLSRLPVEPERAPELVAAFRTRHQHLLNWAALHVQGYVALDEQVAWLAKVLEARDFPIDRLARDLDIATDVVRARVAGAGAVAVALSGAAAMVRSRRPTFL